MKITACILSYNLPEATDELVENMKKMISKPPYDLVVFDNGSDPDKISKYTTHRIEKNKRLVGGFNECFKIAKDNKSDYVWTLVNDIYFKTPEPLFSLFSKISSNPKIGIIHPAIAKDSFSFLDWMKEERRPRHTNIAQVPVIDHICHFYRKEALDVIGWQYDPAFYYGWGVDWDICYRIKKAGFKLMIDFDSIVFHKVSEVYKKGRDKEFKDEKQYYAAARRESNEVLIRKYGRNWHSLIKNFNP